MTENEKVVTALVVGGIIGWLLAPKKAGASGNVNLHFNPYSVQYDVTDSEGNQTVPSNYEPTDATLIPGNYTVNMAFIGG